MEAKKKKNKKKKGSQTKSNDSAPTIEGSQIRPLVSVSSTEKFLPDNEHGSLCESNHHCDAPSNADSQSIGISESDFELERCRNLEAKCGELQSKLRKLEEEKETLSQKEGDLEEKISTLKNKVDSCIERETKLEEKIDVLQNSNASLALQEATLDERVRKIEGVEPWTLEEDSIKEIVTKLGDSNRMLQLQVTELGESRDGLVQEKEQLAESVSILSSRLERLERLSFDASLKLQEGKFPVDAIYATVEQEDKKVTEIHTDSFPRAVDDEDEPMPVTSTTSADHQDRVPESSEKIHGDSTIINGTEDLLQQIQILRLDDARISEDVVSVPLDDIIQEVQPQKDNMEAESAVPLSEAPLIGAPFRLVSFVARYVSGADLVDHRKPKAGR